MIDLIDLIFNNKKDRTPKGDGNLIRYISIIVINILNKKDRTPKGDGNLIK